MAPAYVSCAVPASRFLCRPAPPSVAGDAPAILDVEVEVIAVVVVVAGAEHRAEILAPVGPNGVEEALLTEGEEAGLADVDVPAVVQLDAHDVERIALAV